MKWILFIVTSFATLSSSATDLTPSQKQFIAWGETCCYSPETIKDTLAQQHVDTFQPKVILDLPPFIDPATRLQWVLFYTLQILDVYSTDRAVQYSCVTEVNPLLGKSPTAKDLILLKVILLGPGLYYSNKYEGTITDADLAASNYLMTAVVANNFDVYSQAKKRDNCIKIR